MWFALLIMWEANCYVTPISHSYQWSRDHLIRKWCHNITRIRMLHQLLLNLHHYYLFCTIHQSPNKKHSKTRHMWRHQELNILIRLFQRSYHIVEYSGHALIIYILRWNFNTIKTRLLYCSSFAKTLPVMCIY